MSNNMQKHLKSDKNIYDSFASIIRYEGDNETLVWKHPFEDFNLGSQLIVHESQEAIFFRDGQALDLFGAGRYTLETQKLPLMEKFYKLPTDTEGTFHSEVYYINLATQMGIKWGTDSKVRLFDPSTGMHIEIGASGEFNIHVTNSRKLLLKMVGTTSGLGQAELLGTGGGKGAFRAMVMTQVKSYLAQTIKDNNISILEIDARLMELSAALQERINVYLDDYGLSMPEFYVSRVVTPDDDPNFKRMKQQYADQYLLVREEQIKKSEAEAAQQRKAVEAQTAAQMKVIGAQGEAEALKIQKAAEAEAYRMKGFTYQQQTAREVGLEAMQNGIAGSGAAGGIGEFASLGIGLGAMGGIIGMTKEAMNPIMSAGSEMGQSVVGVADTWNCPTCGAKNITSRFCPDCGKKKPETAPANTWDCTACGTKAILSNFCPNCGAKRPEKLTSWTCPDCGTTDITSNFCPNCGRKRGE